MIWAHFLPKTDWSSLLKWPKVSPGLMRLTLPVQRRGVLLKIFKKVDRLSRAAVANRSALALNALEELLLLCLNENPYSAAAPLDPRIESTINYLSDHFAAKIAVPQLAAKCGLSVSRFAHLFHEQIGLPPLRYLEERRLSRARQLLDVTKLSVAEIAFQIGYHSPFHFSRRFKAFSGKSPISYRNQNA
jgi:AraC family transcriptional regulator of arabinose operon